MFTRKINLHNLQLILFQLLAFCLPFSIELRVWADHKVFLPSEAIMILIVLIMVLDLLMHPGSLKSYLPKAYWIPLPFIIALVLGSTFSVMKLVSLKFSFINILYLLTFFYCLQHLFRKAPWIFHKMVSLYTAGFLVITCLAVYRFANYGWNPVVVKGIFHPFYNDHTIFGATGVLLAIYWLTQSKHSSKWSKLINGILGIALLSAVFLSYSRAAILSIVVSLFFYVLLMLRTKLWQVFTLFGVLIVLLIINSHALLNVLELNKYDSGNQQADLVEHALSSGNVTTDVSNEERLNRWDAGFRMFLDKPLTGFGPGTYQFTYIPFQRPEMMTRLSVKDPYHIPDNSGGTAHSEYILALSEMGILGFLAWLLIPFTLLIMAFKKPFSEKNRRHVLVGFVALSSYFFHAFFNNYLTTDKFAFLFWGLTAWVSFNYYNPLPDET